MGDDFVSAALRHAEDAGLLLREGRYDNAGYLAGYAVECSWKTLISFCSGPAPRSISHDLTTLTGRALELTSILFPGGQVLYRLDVDPAQAKAAWGWSPSWRYATTGTVGQAQAKQLVQAAVDCSERIVHALILDGTVAMPR